MVRRSRLGRFKAKMHKERLTVEQALKNLEHHKIFADYSVMWAKKKTMTKFVRQTREQVKAVAPKATVKLLPQEKYVPFRDFRVNNVTAGQAFYIAAVLSPYGVILKG